MVQDSPQTSSNTSVRNRLVAVDSAIPGILRATLARIHDFDPAIRTFWSEADLGERVETYCLRYVAVVYELYEYDAKDPDRLLDTLAAELLSCVAWRLYDNCVDGHTERCKAHFDSLIAFNHLFRFAQAQMNNSPHVPLEEHYRCMTCASQQEFVSPLPLANIWERCSVVVFPIVSLANLSVELVELFKAYLNYTGLAHDAHDLYDDVALGIKSLPVHWMRQLDDSQVFSEQSVRLLYDRIRAEASDLDERLKGQDFMRTFPLMDALLQDSRETLFPRLK